MMTNVAHKAAVSSRTQSHISEASTEVRNFPFPNSLKEVNKQLHTGAAWCKRISAGDITCPSSRMHILRSPTRHNVLHVRLAPDTSQIASLEVSQQDTVDVFAD